MLNDGVVPSVLLHTLPCGVSGARAEEAVYRQYNSCVDFTFKSDQQYVNARRLKRLNLIFERAADQNFFGLREDKLLTILPPEAAGKYGLDPSAIQSRADAKKKSCMRVLSRGTFLAMFANESNNFINLMAINEKALRLEAKKNKAKNKAKARSRCKPAKPDHPTSQIEPINDTPTHNNNLRRRPRQKSKSKSKARSKRSSSKAAPTHTVTPPKEAPYTDVFDNGLVLDSCLSQTRKTHRRRMSVHSINSEDSPFLMDVPSQITSSIFDPSPANRFNKQPTDTPTLVSDISDSEISYAHSDRIHPQHVYYRNPNNYHYSNHTHYSSSTSHFISGEDSYYNQQSQQSYDGHPADEAGGHASIVSLSSEGSFTPSPAQAPPVHNHFSSHRNPHENYYNINTHHLHHHHQDTIYKENKEKKSRRREQRYIKHQRRMEQFHQEQLLAQNKIKYLHHQQFVSQSNPNKNTQECAFLSSVVNALKHLFPPKQQKIFISPSAVGTYNPHMHNAHEYNIYNSLPPNQRFHGFYRNK